MNADAEQHPPESPEPAPRRRRRKLLAAALAVGVATAALAIDAFVIEPNWIEVTEHRVALAGAPRIRVVHLTDLHMSQMGWRERRALDIVAEANADVVVVTGDLIDSDGRYDVVEEFLGKLSAPLGVFVIEGNWEHWVPCDDFAALCERAGVTYLHNAAKRPHPDLWLGGFDDWMAGEPDGTPLTTAPDDACRLALFHSPQWFDETAGQYALALSGHTHGGQVQLPFVGALWLPRGSGRYVEGWYERSGSKMYVSRGVGMSIIPVRFLCRPEIAIIDLEPK